jgi:tetratricopeptide (TPR) repeat protein
MAQVVALIQGGRYPELENRTRELLVRYPGSGILWKALGLALWLQGKDALQPLSRAAAILPDDAEAHSNLGNALRAAGKPKEALESHRMAVAVRPDYPEGLNNLGSVLLDLGRLDEAAASFRRAVALRPTFALAHGNLANVLRLQNHANESEASCRRALELNPRLSTAIVQLAELQAGKGQFVQAEDLLKQAIEVERDMPEAWAGLVRWRKVKQDDSAWLTEAERIVARPLPPGREVHLRYAMGKYFDDLEDHERAFANFRRANELGKAMRPARALEHFAQVAEHIMRCQDREWLERVRPNSIVRDEPVFIVGMPRSGTTLAEQILASHPEVFGAGEMPFWSNAAARLLGSPFADGEVRDLLGSFGEDYLRLLHQLAPASRRVVDKMPGNFLHLGLIHAALPQARIIHMRRNPIDTCLSIYFQNFGAEHFYANDLDDLARYYTEYARLMDHWRGILPSDKILEVSYEALVEAPETWSRNMLAFLGLPWDARCLDFHENRRTVNTFSKWQARQKISTSSVTRWRNYEKFLGPLMQLAGGRDTARADSARA